MSTLICTSCPQGCTLEVEGEAAGRVSGARCKRGRAYARAEVADPRRIVTTTARVRGGELGLVPVRTREAIPKRAIVSALREMHSLVLVAPVAAGQVVIPSVAGTGVPVVTTRAVVRAPAKDRPESAE